MITQYALGTAYPPTNLELFDPPVSPPMRSVPELYPVSFPRGDGSEAGHGFPVTVWQFQVLTQAEVNALAVICTVSGTLQKSRSVYIRTRKPDNHDEYDYYQAIMVWPQNLTDKRQISGLYLNVDIEFRRLELYTP